MTTVSISPATPADLPEVAALIVEVQQFYGEDESGDTILRNTERALFGTPSDAYALLARTDGRLAGFAAYSYLWPAIGSTRSLFLKELYVRAADRRHGIGRQLMDVLTKIAVEQECSRVEWATETANLAAQGFYSALGPYLQRDKILYRIDLP